LADEMLEINHGTPACEPLKQMKFAGIYVGPTSWAPSSPGQGGATQFSRLRKFDAARRRTRFLEEDAVLIEHMSYNHVSVTFVNLNQSMAKSLIVQGGAYAEHQLVSVSDGKTTAKLDAPHFPLRLSPGAGARLTIRMRRHVNDPTLHLPWHETVAD